MYGHTKFSLDVASAPRDRQILLLFGKFDRFGYLHHNRVILFSVVRWAKTRHEISVQSVFLN